MTHSLPALFVIFALVIIGLALVARGMRPTSARWDTSKADIAPTRNGLPSRLTPCPLPVRDSRPDWESVTVDANAPHWQGVSVADWLESIDWQADETESRQTR